MDFNEWLKEHSLSKYAEVFAENEIDDVEILAEVSEQELESLGIPLGARKKVILAMSKGSTKASPQSGEPAHEPVPEPASDLPSEPQSAGNSKSAPPELKEPESSKAVEEPPLADPEPESIPESEVTEVPEATTTETEFALEDVIAGPEASSFDPGAQLTDFAPPEVFSPHPHPSVGSSRSPVQAKGKSSRKATAIFTAIGIHVVLILIATTLTIFAATRDEPEIIAAIAPPSTTPQQEMKKKAVQKQVKRSPSSSSAAAAPMAQMMKANSEARFTAPDVTRTSTGPLGVGEGDLGAGAFGVGSGLGSGAGDGGSFFGASSNGSRFLFVLDHSKSMSTAQVALRNRELQRSLNTLKGVQYQVLLFAGAAFYAENGWKVSGNGGTTVTGPGNKKYQFVAKKVSDYEFKGANSSLPKTRWLDANPANIKKTMDFIKRTPLVIGTDWEMALRIGHYMEPPPDVIFFMADGTGGNAPAPILQLNKKRGNPVINTVAMQTNQGAKEFGAIAKGTKGTFTIVDKNGKATKGR